jgi:hypothetical protein
MPAERCRVGVIYSGVPQFYVRDTEQKRDGRWIALPLFDPNTAQAAVMSEAAAKTFVTKLRSLGVQNAWIEDCKDGRRIEFASNESPQSQHGDQRTDVRATLDDDQMIASNEARWYTVSPINRPDGAGQWFIKCSPPGFPNAQIIYAKDPVSCLQRALDMNLLQYAKLAPSQEQPKPAASKPNNGRRRPGDL